MFVELCSSILLKAGSRDMAKNLFYKFITILTEWQDNLLHIFNVFYPTEAILQRVLHEYTGISVISG